MRRLLLELFSQSGSRDASGELLIEEGDWEDRFTAY
jgi:hypothetical protein